MIRTSPHIALLAALALSACHSYRARVFVGVATYQLAEVSDPDGGTELYQLHVHSDATAYLNISREGEQPFVFRDVGLELVELDKTRAKKSGVRPFSGLQVHRVKADSPAERAEFEPGDIVLAVNGTDVFLLKDYRMILENLPTAAEARFRVQSIGREKTGDREQQIGERTLVVVSESRMRRTHSSWNVPLEELTRSNPKPFAGVVLRAIPAEYVKKIYGDDRNVPVICGVGLGSPAYLAGLRAGDVIEKVDGQTPPDLDGMLKMFAERGLRGEEVTFEVARERGETYTTRLQLEDYSGWTGAYIPMVFSADSSAHSTEWSTVMGMLSAYDNSYVNSQTREPVQRGSYSMFLGLFKFSWGPRGTRTRLLWFITFG